MRARENRIFSPQHKRLTDTTAHVPIIRDSFGDRITNTVEYRAWCGIKRRCLNPTHPAFQDYGGRGITMYGPWINDPLAFITHVGRRPSPKYSIDRIDNNGNYEPGNMRWATYETQGRNRRSSKLISEDLPFIHHWLLLGYTQSMIGEAFGVDGSLISRIKSKSRWAI